MPHFVYQWHVNLDRFVVRAAVGPVTPEVAKTVDKVVPAEDLDALMQALDADCAPPWCVHGTMEADTWEQVAERVRAWHFT